VRAVRVVLLVLVVPALSRSSTVLSLCVRGEDEVEGEAGTGWWILGVLAPKVNDLRKEPKVWRNEEGGADQEGTVDLVPEWVGVWCEASSGAGRCEM
jgi:hypothetical protein